MLAYATQLTRDRAAAEDVVQEALVRAWRHPDSLVNGKGSVRGWLLTVVRNIVTDQIRARNARAPEVRESPVDVVVDNDHADQVVNSMVVRRRAQPALHRASRGPGAGVPTRQYGRGGRQGSRHPCGYGQIALLLRTAGPARDARRRPRPDGTVCFMKTSDNVNSAGDHVDIAGYLMETLAPEQVRQVEDHLAGLRRVPHRGRVAPGVDDGARSRTRGLAAGRSARGRRPAPAAHAAADPRRSRRGRVGGVPPWWERPRPWSWPPRSPPVSWSGAARSTPRRWLSPRRAWCRPRLRAPGPVLPPTRTPARGSRSRSSRRRVGSGSTRRSPASRRVNAASSKSSVRTARWCWPAVGWSPRRARRPVRTLAGSALIDPSQVAAVRVVTTTGKQFTSVTL